MGLAHYFANNNHRGCKQQNVGRTITFVICAINCFVFLLHHSVYAFDGSKLLLQSEK